MEREQWKRAEEIFHAARQLASGEQRAFVSREAANDSKVLATVLATLDFDLPVTQVGPYRILRQVGAGGMAVVYLGVHCEWHTPAAIKIPRDALVSHDREERFALEQRLLAQLQHPSIARIYEAGVLPDSTPWFAMEYVEGEPITTYSNRASLSVRRRIELFRAVVEAVAYAHAEGVIHRDLKPSNILVKPTGEVKLLDFGIAKQIEEASLAPSITRTGMLPMTLAYAAPEQVFLQQVGKQTDVYALGVLLYELVAGDLPFELTGLSPSKIEEVLSAEVKRPSKVARQWGIDDHAGIAGSAWPDLDVLVLTAMHKDTSKRYESANALGNDINRFLNGEPLRARSDSAGYRFRKFVERRRLPLAFALIAFLAFAGLSVYSAFRLTQSRNAAVAEAARATRIEGFMVNVFKGADPDNGPSKEMKVGALLDRAVEQVRTLDKDARTQGDLYELFGTIYQQFGDYSQAESLLQSALVKRRQTGGPLSPDIAETTVDLGLLRSDQAMYPEAERLVRQGYEMAKRTLPPSDARVGRYETALANVLVSRGNYAAASEALQHAMRIQAGRAESVEDYGACLTLLANVDINTGKLTEAEDLTKQSMKLDIDRHGLESRDLATDLVNLAIIESRQKRYSESEASFYRALAIDMKWFSPGHPETADVKRLLAQVLLENRKNAEAARVTAGALNDLEKAYGPRHPRVAYALLLMGRINLANQSFDAALAVTNRAVDILRANPESDYLAIALSNLGSTYLKMNRYREAERAFSEAFSTFANPPSNGALGVAKVQLGWGDALFEQKRYKEAEQHLVSAYGEFSKEPGQAPDQLATARHHLKSLYAALGQPGKTAQYQ